MNQFVYIFVDKKLCRLIIFLYFTVKFNQIHKQFYSRNFCKCKQKYLIYICLLINNLFKIVYYLILSLINVVL